MAGNGQGPLLLAQFRPAWAAQAYLRVARIKHHVENWTQPWSGTGGSLPQLHSRDSIIPDREILGFLKENCVDLDVDLSSEEKASVAAFESLVRNDLTVALEWSRWVDEVHYSKVTRKLLLAALPFPLNYAWVWYQRKVVLVSLQHHHNISDEVSAKRVARKAYQALSDQLGKKEWMFAKGPTSLDCIVFGHLMDALREPIGSILIHHFSNLVRYCERMQRTLFDSPDPVVVQLSTCSVTPNLFSQSDGFNAVYKAGPLDLSDWGTSGPELDENPEDSEEKRLSAREKEFREGSRNAVFLAGGVVLAYLVFSNAIGFRFLSAMAEDEDDDEDGDLD